MTKKIKKLEKETAMYQSRWESSNKALLEMAEEVIISLYCHAQTTLILVYHHLMDCPNQHHIISDKKPASRGYNTTYLFNLG